MVSKAQESMLLAIKHRSEKMKKGIGKTQGVDHEAVSMDDIYSGLEWIGKMIKEYNLEESLLKKIIEDIYNALMKHKWYEDAGKYAKRFRL